MIHTKAWKLRRGDLLRVGVSTNFVLVRRATVVGRRVVVEKYHGLATTWYEADADVQLSARGLGPDDRLPAEMFERVWKTHTYE
ncbi:hypothetical protein [Actinomadura atramentaria]|uniref:hypothetical protein n=1 Tax=Actinomadura atramentaria TaxID=1990 RepID=UPI00037198C7|nr:hypothetical protein [Actinomadura atramentaria]